MFDASGTGLTGELAMSGIPATPPGRQEERQHCHIGAGLRQRGASGVTVQILDHSTQGFRASTHLELASGTDVWLKLPGLEALHARVAWTRGNAVGCKFVRPLHPAVLSMVVSRP